jgi:hypothetical protein
VATSSPELDQLAGALAAAQGEFPSVGKTHTASIPTKSGGSYCLAPNTRVLTADMAWVPISKVEVGDILAGFDEEAAAPFRCRRWRSAIVEATKTEFVPSYRVTLSNGSVIVASEGHRWLAIDSNSVTRWLETKHLRSASALTAHGTPYQNPTNLMKVVDVWDEPERTFETGYLAAAFDGEGCLCQTPIVRDDRPETFQLHCTFSQRRNIMYDRVTSYLTEAGFPFQEISRGAGTNKDVDSVRIAEGRPEVMRFLGTIRPQRLLDNLSIDSLGTLRTHERLRVENLEFLGETEVVATSTSTGTLIAEGIASHNSYSYADLADTVEVAKPVLLQHGLSVSQMPGLQDGVDVLTTRLLHKSGQWLEDSMRLFLAAEDPRSHGSAITYARRYAYASIIGIVADVDDDVPAASSAPRATGPSASPPPAAPSLKDKVGAAAGRAPAPAASADDVAATTPQQGKIYAEANRLGWSDDDVASYIQSVLGVTVEKSGRNWPISKRQATRLIDAMVKGEGMEGEEIGLGEELKDSAPF